MTIIDKNIFVLTGAGISRESGIKTFREKDGLWDNYRIEDVCTTDAFFKNPDVVNNFYNERKKIYNNVKILPNKGHYALAELEKLCNKKFLLITQNIDNLHKKAGSKKILSMHGSLENLFCMYCGHSIPYDFQISTSYVCKNCGKSGKVRVDVVWFGEQPKYLEEIYNYLDNTDVFISIGTSNNVYPAAGFIDYLLHKKKKVETFEFNTESTSKTNFFDQKFKGPSSITLPKFIKLIKQGIY